MQTIIDAESGVELPVGPVTFRKMMVGDWIRVQVIDDDSGFCYVDVGDREGK